MHIRALPSQPPAFPYERSEASGEEEEIYKSGLSWSEFPYGIEADHAPYRTISLPRGRILYAGC